MQRYFHASFLLGMPTSHLFKAAIACNPPYLTFQCYKIMSTCTRRTRNRIERVDIIIISWKDDHGFSCFCIFGAESYLRLRRSIHHCTWSSHLKPSIVSWTLVPSSNQKSCNHQAANAVALTQSRAECVLFPTRFDRIMMLPCHARGRM